LVPTPPRGSNPAGWLDPSSRAAPRRNNAASSMSRYTASPPFPVTCPPRSHPINPDRWSHDFHHRRSPPSSLNGEICSTNGACLLLVARRRWVRRQPSNEPKAGARSPRSPVRVVTSSRYEMTHRWGRERRPPPVRVATNVISFVPGHGSPFFFGPIRSRLRAKNRPLLDWSKSQWCASLGETGVEMACAPIVLETLLRCCPGHACRIMSGPRDRIHQLVANTGTSPRRGPVPAVLNTSGPSSTEGGRHSL